MTELAAATLTVRPLTPETWDAFAGLAERHDGVWGGEKAGFSYVRSKGKNHTVMRTTIDPAR